jgi:hypothetical protein
VAQGGPNPSSFYVERQALTRSPATPTAPSGLDSIHAFGRNDPGVGNPQAGDGIILANLMALTISIWANPGQTLSGAGTLKCWLYSPYQAAWSRCPDLDLTVNTTGGFNAQTFATLPMPSRLGFIANWLTSGVTVSGGTDVLVRIDGFNSVLGMGS